MGHLDFTTNAGFSWYCVLLLISGLTMIALGPVRRASRSAIALNLVLGIVCLSYGLYLIFGFRGGHYLVSYWALILPAMVITRTARSSNGEKARRRHEATQTRYAELQDAQEAHAAHIERRRPPSP